MVERFGCWKWRWVHAESPRRGAPETGRAAAAPAAFLQLQGVQRLQGGWHPCQRIAVSALLLAAVLAGGCDIKDLRPDKLFERNSPQVSKAIEALDAGQPEAAAALLEGYLETGSCTDGQLGVSNIVRERGQASFDLGLTLFQFGEQFGPRFGQENEGLGQEGPNEEQQRLMNLRAEQVTCALQLLHAIASAPDMPVDFAAHAKYLEGNLEFLRRNYQEAIKAYDEALRLIPALAPEADLGPTEDSLDHKRVKLDRIGADAAWNRAIALRRLEDQKDAGPDSEPDADSDASDSEPDAGSDEPDSGEDSGEDSEEDSGEDSGEGDSGNDDQGDAQADTGQEPEQDGGGKPEQQPEPKDQQPEQPPETVSSQDERILDMLETAPTVQLEQASRDAEKRQLRGMVDK